MVNVVTKLISAIAFSDGAETFIQVTLICIRNEKPDVGHIYIITFEKFIESFQDRESISGQ